MNKPEFPSNRAVNEFGDEAQSPRFSHVLKDCATALKDPLCLWIIIGGLLALLWLIGSWNLSINATVEELNTQNKSQAEELAEWKRLGHKIRTLRQL